MNNNAVVVLDNSIIEVKSNGLNSRCMKGN